MTSPQELVTAFDVHAVRRDFPTVSDAVAYFDSVASSLTPLSVIEAMTDYYTSFRANVHRGSYDLSMRASQRFDDSLTTIARFLNASPEEIVLTSNTTTAINLVAATLDFEPGDEIVLSNLEHTSNMAPWMRLSNKHGVKVRWFNATRDGEFNLDTFRSLLSERTKLVTLAHVTNILGNRAPVEQIGQICRERGILFLIDAAQSAPHLRLDVTKLNCDFLAFSGHKMLGPTGIGVLYIRREHAISLVPGVLGGGTIDTTACAAPTLDGCVLSDCSFTTLPDKWQAGTPPIAEALGLAAAIDYLNGIGLDNIAAHEHQLMQQLLSGLSAIDGVEVYGPADPADRVAVVSFNIVGRDFAEVGQLLNDRYGVAVRAGQHCALNYFFNELHEEDNRAGNVRASLYVYNTAEEVSRLLDAVAELAAETKGQR
ncbi:aminotransferase class V-fold PLP-dependent enzyme [Allorhizocola rhizosphaerae]|uniref:aminotransferase class V-fold PLP-dependent enzyme n=1 Tax=Allorhizocola rhizosphaerae TaxID=1872709 RepID=UPI0013C2BA8C|nr:cysteine desulfurase [Allorhizocola rhizosphaerae]